LFAGIMPPRKPTTKKSPRASKLKEPEVGEVSSPMVMKQLEFSPKPVPIIKTSTKKVFIPPSAFEDMEARIETKTILSHWRELFQKIKQEEFSEYTLHSNPDIRKLDNEVLPNVRKVYLHMVANKTPVFSFIELLKWPIDHTDTQRCLINENNGECFGVLLPVEVQNYYKIKEPEERLNTDFVMIFYEKHDTRKVMAFWWREDKNFTNWTSGWYSITNLRESYIYLMLFLCQLHVEKDFSRFSEAWMRLAYTIAILRIGFNWGAIISKQLSTCIRQAQMPKEGENLILLHRFLFIGSHMC
jgi:hypothetical protein